MKSIIEQVALHWRWITLLVFALITVLSLTPLAHLPEAPGSDKTHHLVAYLALALPIALRGGPKWFLFVPVFIVWGGLIELLQPYVNRYAEWLDFIANSLGVTFATLLGLLLRRTLRR